MSSASQDLEKCPEEAVPASAPMVVAEACSILSSKPILGQPYFTRLRSGSMDKSAFVRSQEQFFHAVRFFSRPIAALTARCPDSSMRMDLVHNLAEEQGDFISSQAHDRTFLSFLKTMGSSAKPAEMHEGSAVRGFNYALLGICQGAEIEVAFACLGMIEYAFADISACIGKTVVDRGWVSHDELVHYKLHAEIDKRHAEEFFAIIEPAWERGGACRQHIRAGLELGRHVFGNLYEQLG